MVDLKPRNNYIILDGDRVIINTAYIGRQFDIRPIVAIDMIGRATSFELKEKSPKGMYEIKLRVKNDNNSFDVYITINNDGNCSASLNNYKIDYVRYSGNFVPLKVKQGGQNTG